MKKLLCVSLVALSFPAFAEEPCKSGLREKQRPGPYTSLISVGPQRGKSHCFVCEAGDRPTVIVFARQLSDPLGKLVHQIDKEVAKHKDADVRAWVTFLAEDQTAFDPQLVKWSQRHATGNVPLGVFEDVVGPPTYLLAREADVTILLSVKQKVVANFAFRQGELNDAGIQAILKTFPKITTK